ncbi:MAG: FKBP-type peptidyl-prolyl cis-trans isomerase [Bacteroidia bacterium]
MKTTVKSFLLVAGLLAVAACNTSTEAELERSFTPNGLAYIIHVNEAEMKAEIGDVLVIHMQYGTKDSVLFDSHKYGRPIFLQVTNPAYPGSIEEGLVLLGTGDSATFFLSADSVYGRIFHQPLPSGIRQGEELIFHIGVITVRNEDRELARYLVNQAITEPARPSGLYVIKSKEGNGKPAKPGARVSLHYTGTLLDGTVFDSSKERNDPFSFVLGQGQVIQGWDEGVSLLKVGDKARFIIPSYLAYGPKGAGSGLIPPYSTLVFDVELLDVQ